MGKKNRAQSSVANQNALLWVMPALLSMGLLLRWAVLGGDFWLDEVWSWQLARSASSIHAIFFELRHDSNHFLTTLYFYLVGPVASEWVYRLPSFAGGIALPYVLYRVMSRYEKSAAILALCFACFSYPLVHYSVEARGYAVMFLCALLAFHCLLRSEEKEGTSHSVPWMLAFGVFSILGLLAHLSFLYVLIASYFWAAGKCWKQGKFQPEAALRSVQLLLLPTVGLFAIWLTNIQFLKVGGAPPTEFAQSLMEMSSWMSGSPTNYFFFLPLLLILISVSVFKTHWKHSERFFFLGLLFGPVILWAVSPSTPPYPRHFLTVFLFSLIPLSRWLCQELKHGTLPVRAFASLALGLWVLGNLAQYSDFYRFRRGSYSAAVEHIVKHSREFPASIATDHDFRNFGMLDFYAGRLRVGEKVRFILNEKALADIPEWVILHSFGLQRPPEPQVKDSKGNIYQLGFASRATPLSGWNWAVYQKDPGVSAGDLTRKSP